MASTSVQPQLVFVDGTFNELAQEMADYVRIGDEVKPLIEKDQQDEILKKIIVASSALNQVPEKEFTAAYNLLVYLVMQSKNADKLLPRVCDNLLKPVTSSPQNGPALALGALTNIFNMVKPDNEIRFHIFSSIVRFVKQYSMFDNLKKHLRTLDSWVEQWEIDEEAQRKLYEEIAEVASDASDEHTSYDFIVKAINTFEKDEVSSEDAQRLALRALKSALLSPTHYDFSDLMSLPAVQALADSHAVYFELLEIFAEKDLEDYNDFNEEHDDFIEKEHLDADLLHRKIRLLTFASLAASQPSREIPYKLITKALQIPENEIELWAIDVIRAGLVEGKLSQREQVFLVHRTVYRVFGEKQWRELGDRVDGWRRTIAAVAAALRKEQANAEAARKREMEELERKLTGAGFEDSGNRRGGDRRRGGGDRDRSDRPPPKPRGDDED
ncbi:PCI-domain-containing protein [Apiospora rasikravindrae]|uniref:Eukaryotic translation initiation factor 3 subunit M n=1 Tax=Apiospora rasikravindrae TaxID=990691 RepID=A0ABR1UBP9_9PEZI